MSINIGLHTNSIVDDYLTATGKTDSKSLLSPQEYLLFRQQAVAEMKQGIQIDVQNPNETLKLPTTCNSSANTEQRKDISKKGHDVAKDKLAEEQDNSITKTPMESKKITPISQGKQKSHNSNNEKLLEIMRAVDS